jgi:hypothetical protein
MANIKITRVKVLKELKDSLKVNLDHIKNNAKADEQYRLDVLAFRERITQAVLDGKVKVADVSFRDSWKNDGMTASLEVNLPKTFKSPDRPVDKGLRPYELDELKQLIRLYEMSDDEFVPAGVHKNLSKFFAI